MNYKSENDHLYKTKKKIANILIKAFKIEIWLPRS